MRMMDWWWLFCLWWWATTGTLQPCAWNQGRHTNLHLVKYAKRCSSLQCAPRQVVDILHYKWISNHHFRPNPVPFNQSFKEMLPLEVGLNNLRGFRLITIYSSLYTPTRQQEHRLPVVIKLITHRTLSSWNVVSEGREIDVVNGTYVTKLNDRS